MEAARPEAFWREDCIKRRERQRRRWSDRLLLKFGEGQRNGDKVKVLDNLQLQAQIHVQFPFSLMFYVFSNQSTVINIKINSAYFYANHILL